MAKTLGLGITSVRAIKNLTDIATACNQAVAILVDNDIVPAQRNAHVLGLLTSAQAAMDNAVRAIEESNRHARRGRYFGKG